MKYRLIVMPRARGDINRNADWWADHYSTEQALKWSDAVYDQIESVCEFPKSHPMSRDNDKFAYELREKLVGLGSRPSYRAIFTVKGDKVFVLTVRAAEQDRAADDVDLDVA